MVPMEFAKSRAMGASVVCLPTCQLAKDVPIFQLGVPVCQTISDLQLKQVTIQEDHNILFTYSLNVYSTRILYIIELF